MAKQAGKDQYFYYNAGTYGSPTWTLTSIVGNVKLTDTAGTADIRRRAMGTVQKVLTQREMAIEFEMVRDRSDAAYAALETKYLAGTLTEFALADGAIATTGTIYTRVECYITQFETNEPIDGAVMTTCKAEPAFGANAPSKTTV